jgi:4a-hydroxytetrahydrobiopterin dehydratase
LPSELNWKKAETPLTKEEIQKALNKIPNWQLSDSSIEKNVQLDSFERAIEFINRVAELSSEMNHHPEIYLWNLKNVKLTLTTLCEHDLSKLDFILAQRIDKIRLK